MSSGQAVIPAWVAPEHERIVELHHLVQQLVEVVGRTEHRGVLDAVRWVTGCDRWAPVTGRDEKLTRDAVRAEALIALNVAAEAPSIVDHAWPLFHLDMAVDFRPAVTDDAEYAYAIWRTLAWIVGTRSDPPVELPERDADGHLIGGPRYASRPNPASAVWRATQAQRRHHARLEAQDHWHRVCEYQRQWRVGA
jgi:hypothetical protein